MDITYIIELIIAIAVMLITRYLIPWVTAHTSAAQLDELAKAAKIAVYAAQELDICGKLVGTKADYALSAVKTALSEKHITYDENTVTAAVKSAVAELRLDMINAGIIDTAEKTQ